MTILHSATSAPESGKVSCLQDAELAITMLYELGEGASEDAMKPGTGALAQLAQGEAPAYLKGLTQVDIISQLC